MTHCGGDCCKECSTMAECGGCIDWLPDYKCLSVQGKTKTHYIEFQIEETEVHIACDIDEPDEPQIYPLETRQQFYTILEAMMTLNPDF